MGARTIKIHEAPEGIVNGKALTYGRLRTFASKLKFAFNPSITKSNNQTIKFTDFQSVGHGWNWGFGSMLAFHLEPGPATVESTHANAYRFSVTGFRIKYDKLSKYIKMGRGPIPPREAGNLSENVLFEYTVIGGDRLVLEDDIEFAYNEISVSPRVTATFGNAHAATTIGNTDINSCFQKLHREGGKSYCTIFERFNVTPPAGLGTFGSLSATQFGEFTFKLDFIKNGKYPHLGTSDKSMIVKKSFNTLNDIKLTWDNFKRDVRLAGGTTYNLMYDCTSGVDSGLTIEPQHNDYVLSTNDTYNVLHFSDFFLGGPGSDYEYSINPNLGTGCGGDDFGGGFG